FPGGIRFATRNDEVAVEPTTQYVAQEHVTPFEAGFRYGTSLIRADIVEKQGDVLKLYEVKAKSCDFADHTGMLNKKDDCIHGDWIEYIQDVAFQKYVVTKAYPDLQIQTHLMLADKTVLCPTDGLNQKFRLTRQTERRVVEVSPALTDADLQPQMLRSINVDKLCDEVFAGTIAKFPFEEGVRVLADKYARDEKIVWQAHPLCKECEFRLTDGIGDGERRSGYRECWIDVLGWTDDDFLTPCSFDVWHVDKKRIVGEWKFRVSDLDEAFIGPKDDGKPGLSRGQRQWLQVSKTQNRDQSIWLDADNLRQEIDSWQHPFHFIDF